MQKKIRFILYDYDHLKCTAALRSLFANERSYGWQVEAAYVQIDPSIPQKTVLELLSMNADKIRHYRWMDETVCYETYEQWEERVDFSAISDAEEVEERKRLARGFGKVTESWDFSRAAEGWEDGYLCFTRSGISYGYNWLDFVDKAWKR